MVVARRGEGALSDIIIITIQPVNGHYFSVLPILQASIT